jgi:hypothetical protein
MFTLINAQTGEVTTRPLTEEEIAALNQPPTPEERIAELKRLLAETDYVALVDYDKEKPEVFAQRQEWRDEIRALEAAQ